MPPPKGSKLHWPRLLTFVTSSDCRYLRDGNVKGAERPMRIHLVYLSDLINVKPRGKRMPFEKGVGGFRVRLFLAGLVLLG